jgi:hypothetical protein
VGWNRDALLIEALALQRLGRWADARKVLERLSARVRGDQDVRQAWSAQLEGERATDRTPASSVR